MYRLEKYKSMKSYMKVITALFYCLEKLGYNDILMFINSVISKLHDGM